MNPGVDLLGDELVRVEQDKTPPQDSWGVSQPVAPEPGPQGPCDLCNDNAAQHRCLHCQKIVCREHYWIMLGLCKGCATEKEARDAREGLGRPRPSLDIKWIEE